MIILHRAFAFSDPIDGLDHEGQQEMETLYDISRRICLESAIQITENLVTQQRKFHIRTIFATSIQHAEEAATVFAKSVEMNHTPKDLSRVCRAYSILIRFIQENATTYEPASKLMVKLGITPRDFDSSRSALVLPPAPSTFPVRLTHSNVQAESRSSGDARPDPEPLPDLSARSDGKSVGSHSEQEPEPNFPNFGNMIYAHEMASLGIGHSL
jgi:hypothetical protein